MKKLIFYVLALVMCIAAVYGISELVLTWTDLPKEYKSHSAPSQFAAVTDPSIGYVNIPSSSIDFVYDQNPRRYFNSNNVVSHHTNSFGFRGTEFSIRKPSGVKRILFLGDSFTFGEGVYDKDTINEQFWRLNNQEKVFSHPIEAINLGVGGFNTSQEWALLNIFGSTLSPDYVVIGYTLNDAEGVLFSIKNGKFLRNNRESKVPEGLPTIINAPECVKRFRMHKLFWQTFHNMQLSRKTVAHYLNLYKPENSDWQKTRAALASIARWSKENKIPVMIVIFPVLYKINDNYPFERIHKILHTELDALGLSYIDLHPALKKYSDKDLWVHPTDQHPNEIVQKTAAELLLKRMRSQ